MTRGGSIGTAGALMALLLLTSGTPGLALDKRGEARERSRDRLENEVSISETAVEGSSYRAYRIETTMDVDVQTAADAAMQILITPSRAPENQARTLVRSIQGSYVVYTVIKVPFVADRDVTVRVTQTRDEATGAWGLNWRATPTAGPPPVPGVVRITKSEGYWRFTPLVSGMTRVVYQNHTDVGGSIPGWLVQSLLRDEAIDQVETLRTSVRELLRAPLDVAGAPPTEAGRPPQ